MLTRWDGVEERDAHDEDTALNAGLQRHLRATDVCVRHSTAYQSKESGQFKGVVYRLDTNSPVVDVSMFSPDWFTGVSIVAVSSEAVEPLLATQATRRRAISNLVDAILSETSDVELDVGPSLRMDREGNADAAPWQCGFDGASCCAGLYSAEVSERLASNDPETSRAVRRYFLLCKAGGGVAAREFHDMLLASAQGGTRSLDTILARRVVDGEEQTTTPQEATRRVASASQRNRARILAIVADVLGCDEVDTLPDLERHAEDTNSRIALVDAYTTTNSIRRVREESSTSDDSYVWQYCSGRVHAPVSSPAPRTARTVLETRTPSWV